MVAKNAREKKMDEREVGAAAATTVGGARSPDDFDAWVARIRARLEGAKGPFFTTRPVRPLFEVYLDVVGWDNPRQTHDCRACQDFLDRYGGLVTVDRVRGRKRPVFWGEPDLGSPYAEAEKALLHAVNRAPIDGVLVDPAAEWGRARTSDWTHFGFPSLDRWSHPTRGAGEVAAEKLEDYRALQRALADFPATIANVAVGVLKADSAFRGEKVLGAAEWFRDLSEEVGRCTNDPDRRANLVWLAAATAPPGYTHVRSSMIGTVLEDIAAGLPGAEVARRFSAKMNPLQYQRPTAAPKSGAIDQAEKAFAVLGAAKSLARRYARLDEIQALWRRAGQAAAPIRGVFGHLRQEAAGTPVDAGGTTAVTWEKFAREVLPRARELECYLPAGRQSFGAIVTAADPNAPPIVQWDLPERRNPFTWYVRVGGSNPQDWNLRGDAWHRVDAVALGPSQWDTVRSYPHQGKRVVLVVNGCRDLFHRIGGGLFPEHLKSEHHAHRAVIEAHANSAEIAGSAEASACGLILAAGQPWNCLVRATSGEVRTTYKLDRWD
jgi:hypothetical protein